MTRQFNVICEIMGKARPRTVFIGGRAHTYTPEKTAQTERIIRYRYKQSFTDPLLTGAIKVKILAYFVPPKSLPQKQKSKLYNGYYTKKPDADNIIKLVLDALNQVAYMDDNQVVEVSIVKKYVANEYDVEHLTILIEEIP